MIYTHCCVGKCYKNQLGGTCNCHCAVCKRADSWKNDRKTYGLSSEQAKLLTARLVEALDLIQTEGKAVIEIGETTYTLHHVEGVNAVYKRLNGRVLWDGPIDMQKFILNTEQVKNIKQPTQVKSDS